MEIFYLHKRLKSLSVGKLILKSNNILTVKLNISNIIVLVNEFRINPVICSELKFKNAFV